MTYPAGLQTLTFGKTFQSEPKNMICPAVVQRLTFGRDLNQSLNNMTCPAGLQSLTLVMFFFYFIFFSLGNVSFCIRVVV